MSVVVFAFFLFFVGCFIIAAAFIITELSRIADALEDFSDNCDEEPARKAS